MENKKKYYNPLVEVTTIESDEMISTSSFLSFLDGTENDDLWYNGQH